MAGCAVRVRSSLGGTLSRGSNGRSARGGLGEPRVVRGCAGRGKGLGHLHHGWDSPPLPGPSFLLRAGPSGRPEAAVTSGLWTALSLLESFPRPSSPSPGVILAPQGTFSGVPWHCLGYYKWRGRGSLLVSRGWRPALLLSDLRCSANNNSYPAPNVRRAEAGKPCPRP